MTPPMTKDQREEPPGRGAATGPCPTLDALVAYFSAHLIAEEEDVLRRHLAACESCRELASRLAGEFVSRPAPATAASQSPRRRSAWRISRLAAQLLLFAGVGWGVYQAAGGGPSAPAYGAVHFSVLDGAGGAVRGDPASDAPEAIAVQPGQELALALSIAEDAHLWVFRAAVDPDAVETIERRFQEVSQGGTSFYSCRIPEGPSLPARSFLVALVSREPFAEDAQDQILELMRSSAGAAQLQSRLERVLRCAARVHELRGGESDLKFGLQMDRGQIRRRVAELRQQLRGGDFAEAHESAGLLLGEVGRRPAAAAARPARPEWWEIGDVERLERLAGRLAAATAPQREAFLAAEHLRAGVVARLPRLIGPQAPEPGEIDTLLAECRTAQELRGRALDAGDPELTDLLHLRAKVLLLAGVELEEAMQLLETVRVQYRESLGDQHPRYADVLNDLAGACRNRGLLEQALHYAVDSLRVYEGAREDPRKIFEVLRSLADIHSGLGAVEIAQSYAELAKAALGPPAQTPEYWLLLANSHLTNAGIHLQSGAVDLARAELESAYALCKDADPRRATTTLFRLGEVLLQAGDYRRAREQLSAVRSADLEFYGERHPFLALDDFLLGTAAMGLEDWPAAASLLESALAYAEDARSSLADIQERAAFGRSFSLESIAHALSKTYLATGRPAKALEAQERGRARLVLDLLSGALGDGAAGAGGPSGEPREEVAAFEALAAAARQKKAEVHQRLGAALAAEARRGGTAAAEVTEATQELALAVRDEWMADLAAAGRWRRIWSEGDPAGAEEIQALLAAEEFLLYFAWSDAGLMLFLVPPRGNGAIEVHSLAEGAEALAELSSRIDLVVNAMSRRRAEPPDGARGAAPPASGEPETIGAAHALYRLLIPAALQPRILAARALYLVPDGPLDRLPFEALVMEEGARWADCRFFLDLGPLIAYLPSGSVLKHLRGLPRGERGADSWTALLVGDPSSPAANLLEREQMTLRAHAGVVPPGEFLASARAAPVELPALPETGHEVEIIQGILGRFGGESELLMKERATVANVQAAAVGKRIVHIAAHGRVGDSLRPYSAGLALSDPPGGGDEESGFLRLRDILERWPRKLLGCELAVLSACDSGSGGAGPYSDFSLPIGFHCAGVPAVVASTWQVDSNVTVHLMCAFYEELFRQPGADKPAALRAAQRRIRGVLADPYSWAAFRYFGDLR